MRAGTLACASELLGMTTRIPATSRGAMYIDLQRPECETAMESLWEFLDAELAPGAARAVGAHLDACERCAPKVHAALAFKRMVRRAGAVVPAPASLRDRVRPRPR